MSETLSAILSRTPALCRDENVFFPTGFEDNLQALLSSAPPEVLKLMGSSPADYHARIDRQIRENFSADWEQRTVMAAEHFPWVGDTDAIFRRIAAEDTLVLDLASSPSMGMIPMLLHCHPHVSACVSDIDGHSMGTLADCLRENLPEYHITTAAFDTNDIPIRDNTLSFVTGLDAMFSSKDPQRNPAIPTTAYSLGRQKAISEVFRILKPGGYFITAEQSLSCDLELPVLRGALRRDTLYGFPVKEFEALLHWLVLESWQNAFTAAGFLIEEEKEYMHRLTGRRLTRFLHQYARRPAADIRPEEDTGLELYVGSSFFILRKPEG